MREKDDLLCVVQGEPEWTDDAGAYAALFPHFCHIHLAIYRLISVDNDLETVDGSKTAFVTSLETKQRIQKKEIKWNIKRTVNEGIQGKINDALNFR